MLLCSWLKRRQMDRERYAGSFFIKRPFVMNVRLFWPGSSRLWFSCYQLGHMGRTGCDADWSLWFEGFLPVCNPFPAIHVFPGEAYSRWTCLLAAVSSEGLLFNAGLLKCLMGKDRTLPHGIWTLLLLLLLYYCAARRQLHVNVSLCTDMLFSHCSSPQDRRN